MKSIHNNFSLSSGLIPPDFWWLLEDAISSFRNRTPGNQSSKQRVLQLNCWDWTDGWERCTWPEKLSKRELVNVSFREFFLFIYVQSKLHHLGGQMKLLPRSCFGTISAAQLKIKLSNTSSAWPFSQLPHSLFPEQNFVEYRRCFLCPLLCLCVRACVRLLFGSWVCVFLTQIKTLRQSHRLYKGSGRSHTLFCRCGTFCSVWHTVAFAQRCFTSGGVSEWNSYVCTSLCQPSVPHSGTREADAHSNEPALCSLVAENHKVWSFLHW